MNFAKTCAIASALACLGGTAGAQPLADPRVWQWGLSAGAQSYREPIMQLQGPELGLLSRWQPAGGFKLEGTLSHARLAYRSATSGTLSDVPQTEASLRWLGPATSLGALGAVEPTLQWSYTHNDLRGRTSTGHLGYERHLNNLWAGVRWTQAPASDGRSLGGAGQFSLDLQALIEGRQQSKLSQADPAYSDVLTRTRGGWAWALRWRMASANGAIEPYVRWQHLERSNKVYDGVGYATEPEHRKVWVGVNWWVQ